MSIRNLFVSPKPKSDRIMFYVTRMNCATFATVGAGVLAIATDSSTALYAATALLGVTCAYGIKAVHTGLQELSDE